MGAAEPHPLDHIIYAAPSLSTGIDELERRLGVRATRGGKHPAWGTHNALIALGDDAYLEIFAPDPEAPAPDTPRPFGLDDLRASRIVTWIAKGTDLERIVARAESLGVSLGAVQSGGRRRSDGVFLTWNITDPLAHRMGGVVPFFIDWGDTPHPAATAAPGCALIGVRAEHPDPNRVGAVLAGLGLDLRVGPGPAPALIATIRSPRGDVELR